VHTARARLAPMRDTLEAFVAREAAEQLPALTVRLQRGEAPVALRRSAIAARDRADRALNQLPLFDEITSANRDAHDPATATRDLAGPEPAPAEIDFRLSVDHHLAVVLALD
jgi:hypothetical protein